MEDFELERQIELLSQRIHGKDQRCPEDDLKELYNLTGLLFRQRYGFTIEHNPCSVPSVSRTVLKMALKLTPCKMLDVGMGGYPFVDIELVRRGFAVTGVEYSYSLTALARDVSRHRGYEFQCLVADGVRLPFPDRSFEACLCSETVEHVADDAAVIREIHRILKPGGTLIFTVPCVVALLGLLKRLMYYARKGTMILHPTHMREYTYASAKRLVDPYFRIQRWYAVPFTNEMFRKMPHEKILSLLVGLPILKHLSLSLAFHLTKRFDDV